MKTKNPKTKNPKTENGKRILYGLASEYFRVPVHGVSEEAVAVTVEFDAVKLARALVFFRDSTLTYALTVRKDGELDLGSLIAFTRPLKKQPVDLVGLCPKGGRTVEIEPPPTQFV